MSKQKASVRYLKKKHKKTFASLIKNHAHLNLWALCGTAQPKGTAGKEKIHGGHVTAQILDESGQNIRKMVHEAELRLKKRRMRREIEQLLLAYASMLTLGEATAAFEALFRKWKKIL